MVADNKNGSSNNKENHPHEAAPKSSIPVGFSPYFWEIEDVSVIDIEKHSFFIIERLLNEGNEETVNWLFASYSEEEIKEVVLSSRRLTEKTAYCWKNFFNLKSEDMQCFGRYLNREELMFLKR